MGGAITNNAAINIQVGFPGGSVAKNLPAKQETPVGEILWRKKWQPTPVILPKKSHGQRAWRATVHGVTKELGTT